MQLKETTPQEMVSHEDFAPSPKTYTKNFIKKRTANTAGK